MLQDLDLANLRHLSQALEDNADEYIDSPVPSEYTPSLPPEQPEDNLDLLQLVEPPIAVDCCQLEASAVANDNPVVASSVGASAVPAAGDGPVVDASALVGAAAGDDPVVASSVGASAAVPAAGDGPVVDASALVGAAAGDDPVVASSVGATAVPAGDGPVDAALVGSAGDDPVVASSAVPAGPVVGASALVGAARDDPVVASLVGASAVPAGPVVDAALVGAAGDDPVASLVGASAAPAGDDPVVASARVGAPAVPVVASALDGASAVPAAVASRIPVLIWTDVRCENCHELSGQFKLAEAPGMRDPPTWFMRVRLEDKSWPMQGPKFHRRQVRLVGRSEDYCRNWIKQKKTCCQG